MKLNRRAFVFSLAALASAPPKHLLGQVPTEPRDGAQGLTALEMETLGHFCEQVIPEDDAPGGAALGVANFIDRMLREAHSDWIVVYREGLKATDRSAHHVYGKPLNGLDFGQQTAVLDAMERGELPGQLWPGPTSSEFFEMVRSHTMQGFYGHPKWGGNRERAAWEMIGYDDWWT